MELTFASGTIRVAGLEPAIGGELGLVWDERENTLRAPATDYRAIVTQLTRRGLTFVDKARAYTEEPFTILGERAPFPHQAEAITAWDRASARGVVVLPTGAGKTFVASLAIAKKKRSTLVVVPTLDLMAQWHQTLRATFACEVGLVGGGSYEPLPLTVTTYDSAHLHMDRLGARYGLIIFDECHHLPSGVYSTAAKMSLAPFRLGLTATPERSDGREDAYDELIGPLVYRKDIRELSGDYLAPYETVRIGITLTDEERAEYQATRGEYTSFLRASGIDMQRSDGFSQFILRASLSSAGRKALLAYRAQRRLAARAPGKIRRLEQLLSLHRSDQLLIFTEDNATVYEIASRFLIPAITHQTKVKERSRILKDFASGALSAIVTSKVLNEGVDVPSASVGIVLSGSGSVREHVQRLGRILRKSDTKRAILYELVAENTGEERTSERRREHDAYK